MVLDASKLGKETRNQPELYSLKLLFWFELLAWLSILVFGALRPRAPAVRWGPGPCPLGQVKWSCAPADLHHFECVTFTHGRP